MYYFNYAARQNKTYIDNKLHNIYQNAILTIAYLEFPSTYFNLTQGNKNSSTYQDFLNVKDFASACDFLDSIPNIETKYNNFVSYASVKEKIDGIKSDFANPYTAIQKYDQFAEAPRFKTNDEAVRYMDRVQADLKQIANSLTPEEKKSSEIMQSLLHFNEIRFTYSYKDLNELLSMYNAYNYVISKQVKIGGYKFVTTADFVNIYKTITNKLPNDSLMKFLEPTLEKINTSTSFDQQLNNLSKAFVDLNNPSAKLALYNYVNLKLFADKQPTIKLNNFKQLEKLAYLDSQEFAAVLANNSHKLYTSPHQTKKPKMINK